MKWKIIAIFAVNTFLNKYAPFARKFQHLTKKKVNLNKNVKIENVGNLVF